MESYRDRLAARRGERAKREATRKAVSITPTILSCNLVSGEQPTYILFPCNGEVSSTVVMPIDANPMTITFSVGKNGVSSTYTYQNDRDKEKPKIVSVPPFVVGSEELLTITLVEGNGAYVGMLFFADTGLMTLYEEGKQDAKLEDIGTPESGLTE